jgi:REP element-mobilizing transposase RayT
MNEWLRTKPVGQAFQPAIKWPELRPLSRDDLQAVGVYRRRLPHWELSGSTYFVTFRVSPAHNTLLWGRLSSLPLSGLSSLPLSGLSSLPSTELPSTDLPSTELAAVVEKALWFGYGERYTLDAYVVMPDHVHLLIKPMAGWSLAKMLQGIKGFTAREINSILGRKGPFWQDENFDHLVRGETDWVDKFNYIHQNPVTAGLVDRPQDYPYSSLVTMHSFGRLESLPHKVIA